MREYRDELPIAEVHGHPHNVRQDLGDLRELTASIREIGVRRCAPAVPRDRDVAVAIARGCDNERLEIMAGLSVVPAIIRTGLTDQQVYQAMLIENLHRVGLTPMEEAHALKGLYDSGMTQQQIAAKIGKSDAFVNHRLVLNELPPEVIGRVTAKEITLTEAVRMGRLLAGRSPEKVDRGWDKPHLALGHPLAEPARRRCYDQGHGLRRRVGRVACGECWEWVIRADATRGFRPAVHHPAPPYTPYSQVREYVTRAQDLAELNDLAGGVRETVMTATPERIRRLLERAFARLAESVRQQQAADERERRSLVQAVEDLTDVFTDDTPEPAAVNG